MSPLHAAACLLHSAMQPATSLEKSVILYQQMGALKINGFYT
jgi:hypothetical protein